MRRVDKLNGLKSWWNKHAKPEYKCLMPAEMLKVECLLEFESCGCIEMPAFKSKSNHTEVFWR